MVVDDYGHHPTEIAAVHRRRARRARPPRSSSCSSRTATRARAICSTSSARRSRGADEVVLTDIYAAGEAPIPGVTVGGGGRRGARDAGARCTWCRRSTTLPAAVANAARPSDLVITLGAGSIGDVGDRILDGARRAGSRRSRRRRRDERQGAGGEELPARQGAAGPATKRTAPAARAGCRGASAAGASRPCAGPLRGLSRHQPRAAGVAALQVRHIAVHGNVRLSSGEVQAIVDGLRGRTS